jgi:hypothetical protein
MFNKVLEICDDSALSYEAVAVGARARKGCKGLANYAKAHLLDAMKFLQPIWTTYDK